jgi:hypothetical protein
LHNLPIDGIGLGRLSPVIGNIIRQRFDFEATDKGLAGRIMTLKTKGSLAQFLHFESRGRRIRRFRVIHHQLIV